MYYQMVIFQIMTKHRRLCACGIVDVRLTFAITLWYSLSFLFSIKPDQDNKKKE